MARKIIIISIYIILMICCCYKDSNIFAEDEIIQGEFEYQGGSTWFLKLPYRIDDNIKYIFHYNTPYAIDIINIYVDGREIPISTDFTLRVIPYDPSIRYNLCEVTENQKKHHIIMIWRRIGLDGIFWEDHTLWFKVIDSPLSDHSRAYFISRKSKEMNIIYRIILPYPLLTAENLFDKDYEHKLYSKEYNLYVDLKSFFSSDSFKIVKW